MKVKSLLSLSHQRPHVSAVVTLALRLFSGWVIALLALHLVPRGNWYHNQQSPLLAPFLRWDSGWYLAISQFGYTTLISHAFFPLYPLLIRVISPIFGFGGGALIVSWASAYFALWGVIDVAEHYVTRQSSLYAAALLAWSPLSVFLIAGYPEGLLVATMIWSLRFCIERRWLLASVLAGIASAVMPEGILSGLVVVVAIVVTQLDRLELWRVTLYAIISEIGVTCYAIFNWAITGSLLINFRAEEQGWGTHLTYPLRVIYDTWQHLIMTGQSPSVVVVLVVNFVGAFVGLLVTIFALVIRRDVKHSWPVVLLLVLGVILALSTTSPSVESTGRFVFFLAPLYVVGAFIIERLPTTVKLKVVRSVLITSIILAVGFSILFNNGWWLT